MTNPETPQNADSNTLKWFVATICREQHDLAYIRIQANSREEAEAKASKYTGELIYDWDTVYGDDWVESVIPNDGKQSYRFSRVDEPEADETPNDGGQDNE
jgi:hypothetical protein